MAQGINIWLDKALSQLAINVFEEPWLYYQCHISYGWTSISNKTTGETWQNQQESKNALFVNPSLFKEGNKYVVLAEISHQLIHVLIGANKGHKNGFKAWMKFLGLIGTPSKTKPGIKFIEKISHYTSIGELPIMPLVTDGKKKQTTRLIKLQCNCNPHRIIRVSKKTYVESPIACLKCKHLFLQRPLFAENLNDKEKSTVAIYINKFANEGLK